MKKNRTENDLVRLMVLVVVLWLGYLLVLAGIDFIFFPRPIFKAPYYLVNGLDALVVLGLSLWPAGRSLLGVWFLPLVIVLFSVVPLVSANLDVLRLPPSPEGTPEAILLRSLPMMLIPLVLTAWKYKWRYVVIYTLIITAFNLGIHGWFYRPEGAPFFPPLMVFAIQSANLLLVGYFICILMGRLHEQNVSLEQANTQLVHYATTLEHLAVSRERNRMARELHDTLAHSLSALSVQLETAKAYFDVDVGTARDQVDKALEQTRSGLVETRMALKSLRTGILDDQGLLLAIRNLAQDAAMRGKFKLDLSLPVRIDSLPTDVEHTLYRVAQESIANVLYHSQARTLTVILMADDGRYGLMIRDDGIGFDIKHLEIANHYGLIGMKERADLVGGLLSIESIPGKGTTIEIEIRG